MMRTKHVVMSSTAGARLSTVSNRTICSDDVSPSRLVHESGFPATCSSHPRGGGGGWGAAGGCASAGTPNPVSTSSASSPTAHVRHAAVRRSVGGGDGEDMEGTAQKGRRKLGSRASFGCSRGTGIWAEESWCSALVFDLGKHLAEGGANAARTTPFACGADL